MPKYTVSADILLPVLLEIEADNEEQAIEKLYEMDHRKLVELANTDDPFILDNSIDIDHAL